MTGLTSDETARYVRHIALPQIGLEGQRRLRSSSVLVIGAGGLGCPALMYLASGGIGRIGIVDDDVVSVNNLHRQVLFSFSDAGKNKARAASARLKDMNPFCDVVTIEKRFSPSSAETMLSGWDAVLDCTDNFPTRNLISAACLLSGKPLVYGAVYRFEGHASVFNHAGGPCYRCLFPSLGGEKSGSCEESGIIGPAAGVIGSVMALEAMKVVLGLETLSGKLFTFDGQFNESGVLPVKKLPSCPFCHAPSELRLDRLEGPAPCRTFRAAKISPEKLSARMAAGERIQLVDVRFEWERGLCFIKGDVSLPLERIAGGDVPLDPSLETVIYCKDESRSVRAAELLASKGFGKLSVLEGGITLWADKIDGNMTRY